MGIHHWTRYSGYEKECCEGLKQLLNLFCFNCHTPNDVNGCHKCDIGKANFMMLDYLKHNLKPNKELTKLINCIEKEEQFYCFIRLRSKFTPKKVSKLYMDTQKKLDKGWKKYKFMIKIWASNREECDRILYLIERLKQRKLKIFY